MKMQVVQSKQTQEHLRTVLLLKYHDGMNGSPGEAEMAEPRRSVVEPTAPAHQTDQVGDTTA